MCRGDRPPGIVSPPAADALGKLGEHAAPAVPALTKCLQDPQGPVSCYARKAVDKLGYNALGETAAKRRRIMTNEQC